jgi:hypothetical protein
MVKHVFIDTLMKSILQVLDRLGPSEGRRDEMVKHTFIVTLMKSILQVLDRLGPSEGRRHAEAIEELITIGNSPESP